jgi:hypothetical protein
MALATASSRPVPLTASTTRPSQSVLIPYTNRAPGSATIGALKITSEPDSTFGVPVARSQANTPELQNQ